MIGARKRNQESWPATPPFTTPQNPEQDRDTRRLPAIPALSSSPLPANVLETETPSLALFLYVGATSSPERHSQQHLGAVSCQHPRTSLPNLVILKMRRSRMQRSTEMPKGDKVPSSTRMVSKIPEHTTKQSKRLKSDMKYWRRPSAYIFSSISATKRASSTRLALSGVGDPARQSTDLSLRRKGRRAVLFTSLLCPPSPQAGTAANQGATGEEDEEQGDVQLCAKAAVLSR